MRKNNNNNNNSRPTPSSPPQHATNNNDRKSEIFTSYYTSRDAILYALGIGCTPSFNNKNNNDDDDDDDELRYLYESHDEFTYFPLFPFSLSFRSVPTTQQPSLGIVPFPPHLIRDSFSVTTPSDRDNNDDDDDVSNPILHVSQSVTLYPQSPLPLSDPSKDDNYDDNIRKINFTSRVISIKPHLQRGTFVTHETIGSTTTASSIDKDDNQQEQQEQEQNERIVFTSRMTSLVVGRQLPPYQKNNNDDDPVESNNRNDASPPPDDDDDALFVKRFVISPQQALIYRLSGDYNAIHVEGDRPILHGLCTMAMGLRGVLQFLRQRRRRRQQKQDCKHVVTFIQCDFKKFVRIGDVIYVHVWQVNRESSCLRFEIRNDDGDVVVKNGVVDLADDAVGRSRL